MRATSARAAARRRGPAATTDVPVGLGAIAATPLATRRASAAAVNVRSACASDVPAIHELIEQHVTEGRLLRRSPADIAAHVDRFVVAVSDARVVGCADLAPLSGAVAEVRSLVVADEMRAQGIGRQIVNALVEHAAGAGFRKVCASTHAPRYFVRMGFSIVPRAWVPEKIEKDCAACAHFRQCGQYAVVLPLGCTPRAGVLASVHG